MILSDEERRKFVEYLEQDAATSARLAEQALQLPGMEMVAKGMRVDAAASRHVANRLKHTESMTITGEPTP